MTVKTLANILVPIIKPTLKKANFDPKIFVNPKDNAANKRNIVTMNKKLFLISRDLHKKSYITQEIIIDKTENVIAASGEITSTLLSTIKIPEL
tara:strand:- start:13 stop:294 length:282 start_codon:yes stop_codon:yes gene_type:complete